MAEYKFIAQYGNEKGQEYFQENYVTNLEIVLLLNLVGLLLFIYSSYVSHAFYKNNSKNTRDIIYIFSLILIIAVFTALYYSEQIFQLQQQNYFPGQDLKKELIYGIQITGICYIFGAILIFIVNIMKKKIWYINITVLLIILATAMISLNGNLYRMTYPIIHQFDQEQSCKKYIRWVPEPTLQQQGCRNKYTEYMGAQATKPLSCPQSNQMFTSNEEQLKFGMTACLEKECCGVMNILYTSPIINLASMCVFIPIFSMIIMYTSYYLSNKYQQRDGVNKSEIIFSILLAIVIFGGSYMIYQQKIGTVEEIRNELHNFNDTQQNLQQQQNMINHSHQIINSQKNKNVQEQLDTNLNLTQNVSENYQKRMLNYEQDAMQLDNCDVINNLLQPKIQPIISHNICISNDCQSDGIRVSLLAKGGIFSKNLQLFNSEYIKIFDERVMDLIFSKQDIQEFTDQNTGQFDSRQFLTFQGKIEDLQQFLNEQLQFCLQQPFDVLLRVVFVQIDLSVQKSQLQNEIQEGVEINNTIHNIKSSQFQQQKQKIQDQSQISINNNINNVNNQQIQKNDILSKFQNIQKNHYFSDVQVELFSVEDGQKIEDLDVEINLYMDIVKCQPTLFQQPMYTHQYNYQGQNDKDNKNKIYLRNLALGYYTLVLNAKGYNISCQEINVNQSNSIIQKRVPLVKQNEYRIVLQWDNPEVNLQLYTQVSDTCYASLLNPSCEGMKFINYKEKNGFQSIVLNKIEQQENYLVFVNEYISQETLDHQTKLKKLLTPNQTFLESDPKIFYYVPELEYPAEIIKMPFVNSQNLNNYETKLTYKVLNSSVSIIGKIEYERNLAWLVMCLDGSQGDIASKIQEFWVEKSKIPYITKDKSQLYPTLSICEQMKDWKN